MSVVELLSELNSKHIRLRTDGQQLSVEAPPGALTEELRARLEPHRSSLIALLRQQPESFGSVKKQESDPAYGGGNGEAALPDADGVRRQQGRPLTAEEILANARALVPTLRERSADIEAARRLPKEVVQLLRDAGVFRMNMPKIWGGPEMTPMQQNEVIAELTRGNGSVGWCVMIGADSGIMSAYLDDDVAREMYPRLDMVQAGWYQPVGRMQKTRGGYIVNGKWAFASGCTHCDWLSAGCLLLDENGQTTPSSFGFPEWKVVMAKPEEYELIDTWHTTGLQGSGSLDYVAKDLFIPEERTFSFFDKPKREGILYSAPDTYLRKMPGIPLGIARDAIDTVTKMMSEKLEVPTMRPYCEMPRVQSAIAQAEGLYGGARAYLFDSLETQWERLEQREPLTKKERADMWLARINMFQSARQIVELLFDTVGGSAIYSKKSSLDRHLRDVITISQHIVGQKKSWETVGAMLLHPRGETQVPFL